MSFGVDGLKWFFSLKPVEYFFGVGERGWWWWDGEGMLGLKVLG